MAGLCRLCGRARLAPIPAPSESLACLERRATDVRACSRTVSESFGLTTRDLSCPVRAASIPAAVTRSL